MSSTHSPNRSSALSSLSPPPPPPPTLSPLPNLPSSPFLFHNPIFDNTEYVVKKLHPASFNHNSPTTVEFKKSLVRAIQKDPSRLPSHLILLPPSPRFTRYSPKSAASPLPSPPTPPFQNSKIPKLLRAIERRLRRPRTTVFLTTPSNNRSSNRGGNFEDLEGRGTSVHSRYLTTGRR